MVADPTVSARDRTRRYLGWMLLNVTALLLLTAVANALINPYGIFSTPEIPGLNAVKVRASQQREIFKAAGLERVRPSILVVGNSRAEIGFDPRSPAWPPGSVYNTALAGGNLRTSARMLATAAGMSIPKIVVLGIDFPEFLTSATDPLQLPALAIKSQYAVRPTGADYAASLISLDTLASSMRTIAGQHDQHAEQLTALGFNPLLEYPLLVSREGQHALFQLKNEEYAARYTARAFTLYPPGQDTSPDVAQLREIIDFCRAHAVTLKLVIYPYHAHLLETLDRADLWNAYEEWKRLLAHTVAQESSTTFQFELWDFGTYAEYTTESPPRGNDRATTLEWFWESGHFRPALGDIMLHEMFSGDASFGSKVAMTNVEEHLADVRRRRLSYRSTHANEAADIAAMVARVRPQPNSALR